MRAAKDTRLRNLSFNDATKTRCGWPWADTVLTAHHRLTTRAAA